MTYQALTGFPMSVDHVDDDVEIDLTAQVTDDARAAVVSQYRDRNPTSGHPLNRALYDADGLAWTIWDEEADGMPSLPYKLRDLDQRTLQGLAAGVLACVRVAGLTLDPTRPDFHQPRDATGWALVRLATVVLAEVGECDTILADLYPYDDSYPRDE